MARGVELATGYVTLTVETSDVGRAIGQRFSKVEGLASTTGQKAGRAMSNAFNKAKPIDTDRIKRQQEELQTKVEQTEEKIRQSKDKTSREIEQANRKVEIAEAKLDEARRKNETRAERIEQAERELQQARERGEGGTRDFERLESELERARKSAETPTSRLLQLEDQLSLARQKAEASTRAADAQSEKYTRELNEQRASLNRLGDELNRAERETEGTGNAFQRLGRKMGDAFKNREWKQAFGRIEREGEDTARELERDFDRSGRDSGSKFGGGFTRAFSGAVAGLGAYVGISELFEFGKYAVSGAADLEQSIGGVNTVFKGSADQMLEWSNAADQTLGLTANEYNEFAAKLGASLKNAGTPIDELGSKTNDLITMGADLASLYGGTTAEAVDALGSALRGEMDPIERYGISLNAAALDAEGLAMGLEKTGGSWSTQEKQLISMSLLQKQSADATGNFAREQDTASNVAQRLTARLKETATEIGSRYTPYLAAMGSWLLDKGLPAVETFAAGMESAWSVLFKGEFNGNLFGLEEDSAFVDFLFNVREGFVGIWDGVKGWINSDQGQEFFGKIRDVGLKLWEDVLKPFGTWFMEQVPKFLPTLGKLAVAFSAVVATIVGLGLGVVVAQFMATMAVGVGVIWPILKWTVDFIQNVVWPALVVAFKAIGDAAVWLWLNALKPAWDGIAWVIGGVVNWVRDSAVPWLQQAWQAIAGAATWLWQNVLVPVWSGIRGAIEAVVGWVLNSAVPFLQSAWQTIAGAATWLWQNVFSPVWEGIKVAVAVAVTAIVVAMDLLSWVWQNTVAPVLRWLNEKVFQPVWAAIRLAIQVVVTWFKDVAWPVLQTTIGWIVAGFNWLRDRLSDAWSWVKNNVISPVVNWFKNTAWPLLQSVVGWIVDRFNWLRDRLSDAWSWVKNNVINPVVSWFRDTAWPLLRDVAGSIVDRFNWLRDRLRDAWNFVKDRVIAPVANWFRDTIQPLFERTTDGVGKSFETLQDTVERVWNGIRDKAKAPIRFVVQDIVRDGIVKKYNKVADTFGAKTIDEGLFTVGWATGGWTGPGAKYDPAGVVHADEFVIRKESQRDLRRRAPGLLDDLNLHGFDALRNIGYASGGWVKPFRGNYSSNSPYGPRGGRLHAGMDFPTPSGTPVVAVSDGTVTGRGFNSAAGNKISLKTDMAGIVAGYHHLSRYAVALGQAVRRGQVLGYTGNTGRSTGPHLHFSIKRDGGYVNPSPYLSGTGAAGTGSGDDGGWGILNPFEGLWNTLKDRVRAGVGDTAWGDAMFGFPKKVVDEGLSFVTDKIAAIGDWASDQVDTTVAGVKATRWTPMATRALTMEGAFSTGNLQALLRRMNQESGFNPRAVNNWDSNAKRGTPSKGLMQVIGPTFRAYARPGYDKDIFDPLSNTLASIRYTRATYPSLQAGWNRRGGYADGGLVTKTNLFDTGGLLDHRAAAVNLSGKPEAVLNPTETRAYQEVAEYLVSGAGTERVVNYHNTIHAEQDTARELVGELSWEQKRLERRSQGRYKVRG